MKNLELVKSEHFGAIQADIYSNGKDMFMTAAQLCECLGEKRSTFDARISRNPRLKNSEFSVSYKMQGTDGKMYNTRVFNEDGIYEITLLSESKVGAEFRSWVRKILKSLRSGQAKLVDMTEYQKLTMQTRQENIKVRKARLLKAIADDCAIPEYKQVLQSKATEILTGQALLPLPTAERRTYTATEIGLMFGVSKNTVGKIANAHGLKTDEYGKLFYDRAAHVEKQVESWRYYESAIKEFEHILGTKAVM